MKARLLQQGYEALKKTDRLSGEKKTHRLAENACIGIVTSRKRKVGKFGNVC